jgi:hypothetical protein
MLCCDVCVAAAPQYGSAKSVANIAGMVAGNVLRGDHPMVTWDVVDWDAVRGDTGALIVDVREVRVDVDNAIAFGIHPFLVMLWWWIGKLVASCGNMCVASLTVRHRPLHQHKRGAYDKACVLVSTPWLLWRTACSFLLHCSFLQCILAAAPAAAAAAAASACGGVTWVHPWCCQLPTELPERETGRAATGQEALRLLPGGTRGGGMRTLMCAEAGSMVDVKHQLHRRVVCQAEWSST